MKTLLRLLSALVEALPWLGWMTARGRASRAERRAQDAEGLLKKREIEDEIHSDDPVSISKRLHRWDK